MSEAMYKIVDVNADNVDEIDIYCSRSKHKEEGYQRKLAWIKDRFEEGLEYRVLLVDEGRKDLAYRGMIEFMPGEKCWRGINAPNYMVIHCIWVIGRHKNKGYGTKLLQECINSAKEKNMNGVAVMTIKKGGWSPKKDIFIKDGIIVDKVNGEAKVIDASGKIVMPGGVDIHAHIAGAKVNTGRALRPEDKPPEYNEIKSKTRRSGG